MYGASLNERPTSRDITTTLHLSRCRYWGGNMDKDALQRAYQHFRTRIEAIIEAKGGYIE